MEQYTTSVYTSPNGAKKFVLRDKYGRTVIDNPCHDGSEARDFHTLLLVAQANGLRIVKADNALYGFTLEGT